MVFTLSPTYLDWMMYGTPLFCSWMEELSPPLTTPPPSTLIQVLIQNVIISHWSSWTAYDLGHQYPPSAQYYISQLSATSPQYTEHNDEVILNSFIKRNVAAIFNQVCNGWEQYLTLILVALVVLFCGLFSCLLFRHFTISSSSEWDMSAWGVGRTASIPTPSQCLAVGCWLPLLSALCRGGGVGWTCSSQDNPGKNLL